MNSKINIEKIRVGLEEQRKSLKHRLENEIRQSNQGLVINPDRSDLARSYDLLQRSEALEEQLHRQLDQIEGALLRIENGTYGICEICGQPIAPERLEALPYATRCIQCQSKRN